MNLTVEQADLLVLLDNAKAIVDKKATLPLLQNCLLTTEGERLRLRTTDLEVHYTGSCQAKVAEQGTVCVFAAKLHELVKLLPKGEVALAAEGADLRLESQRVRYLVRGLSPDEFPTPPQGETEPLAVGDGAQLALALGRVLPSASPDQDNLRLNAVYFEPVREGSNHILRLVTTDGHRLALDDVQLDQPAPLDQGLVVPLKAVQALHKVMGDGSDAELSLSQKLVDLIADGHRLRAVPVQADFPDYHPVIPKKLPNQAVVPRARLAEALKRVAAIDGKKGALTLSLTYDLLEIAATPGDYGEADEHLDVEYQGPDVELSFNPGYLVEACAVLRGEELVLAFKDDGHPLRITDPSAPGFMAVIMPMRR